MAARLVALVTLLAFLAGCGGRPVGVMTPTGQVVQGTTPVNLLVAQCTHDFKVRAMARHEPIGGEA